MTIEQLNKAVPHWDFPEYRPSEKIALFIPCFMDQFFPEAAIAMTKIFDRLGVAYTYPPEQTCCGQPAFNSGYRKDAIKVMNKFHEVFGDYDLIVTPSSACAAMARVLFAEADPDLPAARTGSRVFEFCEFLVNILKVTDLGARYPRKVGLHVGCHGRRELGMADAAETLLLNVKDIEYTPIPAVDECCGFGGTFSVKMAGTSLAMGKLKVENILKSGADVVATPDLSCAMHFGGMMHHDPTCRKVDIFHIAEILVHQ